MLINKHLGADLGSYSWTVCLWFPVRYRQMLTNHPGIWISDQALHMLTRISLKIIGFIITLQGNLVADRHSVLPSVYFALVCRIHLALGFSCEWFGEEHFLCSLSFHWILTKTSVREVPGRDAIHVKVSSSCLRDFHVCRINKLHLGTSCASKLIVRPAGLNSIPMCCPFSSHLL